MNEIASDEQKELASKLRNILSVYEANQDLIAIGAYKKGSSRAIDEAIEKIDRINEFLKQKTDEAFEYEETLELMAKAVE